MVNDACAQNEIRIHRRNVVTKVFGQCAIWFVLILMYVPILVLIASSFTDTEVIGQWGDFSFGLYERLFHDEEIGIALANTVISLYYYLLIVKAMYIKPNESPIAKFQSDGYTRLALTLSLLGVIVFGLGGVFYTYIEQFSYGL